MYSMSASMKNGAHNKSVLLLDTSICTQSKWTRLGCKCVLQRVVHSSKDIRLELRNGLKTDTVCPDESHIYQIPPVGNSHVFLRMLLCKKWN